MSAWGTRLLCAFTKCISKASYFEHCNHYFALFFLRFILFSKTRTFVIFKQKKNNKNNNKLKETGSTVFQEKGQPSPTAVPKGLLPSASDKSASCRLVGWYSPSLNPSFNLKLIFAGPNEIYHTQITTNINYSYWMKDGVQQESWTQNDHHPRVNSEMTRYHSIMILCPFM